MPVTSPAAPAAVSPAPDALPQDFDALLRQDPEVAGVLLAETGRQAATLQLIAAENFQSPAVLAALGSPLGNKYAEGYPGARHHGGCEHADAAERIAVRRATALFGAEHANVQPHSGSSAVLAAYAALLRPGDTVLAMGLPYGGHLTHGAPGNFSGRWFDFAGYGVDPGTGLIDYTRLRALARARRPKAIVCGSISYPRHPDYALFREIADEAGAYLIVDAAHPMGLIAGGAAPNPVPYADVVCATTHKVLRGPRGGMILCGAELAERIDRAVFPFTQGGAQMHTVAAKAVAFGEAATPAYTLYAHRVVAHARVLAAGLEAEGFEVTTGGTDTHIVVADPAPLGVDGRTARERLAAAGVVLDTCALPYGDARGIRLGTAAVTTQGMDDGDMARIAALFGAAVREPGDVSPVAAEVRELAARHPPYPG
ncbi:MULTISPECIES: serine hydroxymethyltransferase [Streptomyces]|uniref:Serine hydroxymethyltransferase n=1 Tax=Streptomyces griseus subsp. griseus (strain JCM 4626 / CBS 651.72 / NBRC 13350 / KCC S-0626 / ISP 5235) TaxID=455632 RepID=B1W0B2_STRGG|nr:MULTISPECIES: serine hydroxymethyltransferase [Streptomyces]MYT77126.1 aminotransferase class I/II-fold pyridoxal phosphate-dependent enzyme [Streptomyces sp. SID8364]MBW3704647.1 serine hydroxymethyltransferase [Streptomyces griseus]SBU89337.1 serine hydroxymethyltransferase [Streptomyces sp. MnatMP-M77]SED33827.1 glycine hydroxymethyltransferase [Streptomyces griseus]SQA24189.1 Serine hydroxymethyltransferase [Streptomyces griseus]